MTYDRSVVFAAIHTNVIVLALTRTEFELTIYCIRDKMLTTTPPILFYAEMRIAISSSKGIIQVRVFKFVNDKIGVKNHQTNKQKQRLVCSESK
jgi:hypothetical protein